MTFVSCLEKKWSELFTTSCLTSILSCSFNFLIKLAKTLWSIKLSLSPEKIKPDEGQGAKKLKSYFPAGGPNKINFVIKGEIK